MLSVLDHNNKEKHTHLEKLLEQSLSLKKTEKHKVPYLRMNMDNLQTLKHMWTKEQVYHS